MISLQDLINRLASIDNSAPDDYEENGIRMCGKCHSPKQRMQEFSLPRDGHYSRLVPVLCRCGQEKQQQEEMKAQKEQFLCRMKEHQDKFNISDRAYKNFTFAKDDRRNEKLSDVCLRYVEQWQEMKADNMGILFHGSVGTGKSFYACSIVNALLERCVPGVVTNFPRLLNILQNARERQEYIDHLNTYQLLVIDDLGVERDSSYAAEQVFSVIDARARAELPLIVTTNLTIEELKTPSTMQYARIYDRVLELCPISIKMAGESRRAGNAATRKAKAQELLMRG
jgi:DNA replication protein DnaC